MNEERTDDPMAEASGEPAGDLPDPTSFSPTGNRPSHHWKSSTVAEPGLEQRGTVFFAALQSAQKASALVQRLLAFARRQPLQPMAVDLSRLVNDMAGLLASTLGPQIRIMLDCPDGLPCALADANQVEMALLNLSVNARDAMPDGGTLTIRVARGDVAGDQGDLAPGAYLRLSVTDTG